MSLTDTPPAPRRGAAGLAFRPASLDDARWTADLLTARVPDEPTDPELLRHWWASDDPEWTIERFVVERAGVAIGLAWQVHARWEKMPERYARVGAALLQELEEEGTALHAAYEAMEDRARRDGAKTFATSAREDREHVVRLIESRGYTEERRSKSWELDLLANVGRLRGMAEGSRARMREQGVQLLTIARDSDPEKYRLLHAMSEEAVQDVPTTIPNVDESFEQFMKWFDSPGLHEDRLWIARESGDVVGVSVLSYPPVRGNVWTDWTATGRRVRGRGIARALKLETVLQAIDLGVTRVRTGNDGKNDPILHLNEALGYRPIPGSIQLLKPARQDRADPV